MPGQILGDRYQVEQQLGKKAGRWTLLARDLTTDTLVILKLLFIDDTIHRDEIKLFTREVNILQSLDHPGTPKYLGYFEIDLAFDGKALALIQSYMNGISLETWLKQGKTLTEQEAQHIAQTTLPILAYMHDHNPPVVHRDIKPSNLLFSNSNLLTTEVYLVDFGSVKTFNPAEITSFMLVGTNGYMPPEQMGRRAVRASDLYSLGVTLLAGMTGLEPGYLPQHGLRFQLDQIEQLNSLSPAFKEWLQQMIEPDLDNRFKTAQEAYTFFKSR
jgi:serine/threonine protein kinase